MHEYALLGHFLNLFLFKVGLYKIPNTFPPPLPWTPLLLNTSYSIKEDKEKKRKKKIEKVKNIRLKGKNIGLVEIGSKKSFKGKLYTPG